MCSPDPLDQIREQSRIVRRAIAEARDIIADCIAALERGAHAAGSEAAVRHVEHADPPFPPSP